MGNILKYLYLRTFAFVCNISPYILQLVRNNNIKGKGQLVKYLKINDENITADCDGITFNLNLKDDVQQWLYMNAYEKDNVNFVLNLLAEGDVFFDSGANAGAYTLQAAKKLGTGTNIYSFEPDPVNFKSLDINCNLNEFSKNVNRYELALTSFTGTAPFYQSDSSHSGWHSLTEFKDISKNKINVSTSTLDSFIESKKINKIKLIKIDVEANEFELLKGAVNALKNRVFSNIYVEFNGARLAEKKMNISDIVNFLNKYSYCAGDINLKLLDKILKGELSQTGICENFLFVPKKQ